MSILLYVSLRKTVVTVGHRGLRDLRRQFKTSGFFCRIKFINHPSVKYIQDVRRIRPFSFYLNGVNWFEIAGILYEFERNIFQAFMTFLKLKCLWEIFLLFPADKRGRSCQMAGWFLVLMIIFLMQPAFHRKALLLRGDCLRWWKVLDSKLWGHIRLTSYFPVWQTYTHKFFVWVISVLYDRLRTASG